MENSMNDDYTRFIHDKAIEYFRMRRFSPFKSKAWFYWVKGARYFIRAYRERVGSRLPSKLKT
jgi:hypothetical protein